jgi:hypothetical protein
MGLRRMVEWRVTAPVFIDLGTHTRPAKHSHDNDDDTHPWKLGATAKQGTRPASVRSRQFQFALAHVSLEKPGMPETWYRYLGIPCNYCRQRPGPDRVLRQHQSASEVTDTRLPYRKVTKKDSLFVRNVRFLRRGPVGWVISYHGNRIRIRTAQKRYRGFDLAIHTPWSNETAGLRGALAATESLATRPNMLTC